MNDILFSFLRLFEALQKVQVLGGTITQNPPAAAANITVATGRAAGGGGLVGGVLGGGGGSLIDIENSSILNKL